MLVLGVLTIGLQGMDQALQSAQLSAPLGMLEALTLVLYLDISVAAFSQGSDSVLFDLCCSGLTSTSVLGQESCVVLDSELGVHAVLNLGENFSEGGLIGCGHWVFKLISGHLIPWQLEWHPPNWSWFRWR